MVLWRGSSASRAPEATRSKASSATQVKKATSKVLRAPRVLKVASDFSGLDSAWLAVQRLGVPASLQFCCDSDKHCKALLTHLHSPLKFYDNISERQDAEYCDLYITSPPCQPFSKLGKQAGIGDKRGQVVKDSLRYVQQCRPRVVVMENVKALGTDKKFRPVLKGIVKAFKSLRYRVRARILDSQHYGVPQIRTRLFLVAIREDSARAGGFAWPAKQQPCKLHQVLDAPGPGDLPGRLPRNERQKRLCVRAYKAAYDQGFDPRRVPVAVDVDCSERYATFGIDVSRTLTRTRGGQGGFWLSSRGRKMSITELMRVTGIEPKEMKDWRDVVPERELGRMLGNSIPVPMIQAVLKNAMIAGGLLANAKLKKSAGQPA